MLVSESTLWMIQDGGKTEIEPSTRTRNKTLSVFIVQGLSWCSEQGQLRCNKSVLSEEVQCTFLIHSELGLYDWLLG